jgi:hypothetical protein
MRIEQIIAECVERKKIDGTKTAAQIVDSVMDEIAGYRTALRARPEFKMDPAEVSIAPAEIAVK